MTRVSVDAVADDGARCRILGDCSREDNTICGLREIHKGFREATLKFNCPLWPLAAFPTSSHTSISKSMSPNLHFGDRGILSKAPAASADTSAAAVLVNCWGIVFDNQRRENRGRLFGSVIADLECTFDKVENRHPARRRSDLFCGRGEDARRFA
ncbi:hypothetical protein BC936DRAFT_144946 [Jimgerdemannia flammicorona]|uniref:Uncharacterized protein n=1 Tax=Jimgerdemannia flammicorona TaxID=994334 RepID=A0A433DNI4_9FUNG|nr:hypothetical protein BC936DRAFT_144946 [Jimgerdemannia flammicorona]